MAGKDKVLRLRLALQLCSFCGAPFSDPCKDAVLKYRNGLYQKLNPAGMTPRGQHQFRRAIRKFQQNCRWLFFNVLMQQAIFCVVLHVAIVLGGHMASPCFLTHIWSYCTCAHATVASSW
eukprot:3461725-Amphidinium_carterae.1